MPTSDEREGVHVSQVVVPVSLTQEINICHVHANTWTVSSFGGDKQVLTYFGVGTPFVASSYLSLSEGGAQHL